MGVPTCRPRGVELEVEPARGRVPAHAPQDHRPLALGAVPVPRASRASPVVASSEVLVGSWPARFRFRLTPQGAVPSSPATRAQPGPRRPALRALVRPRCCCCPRRRRPASLCCSLSASCANTSAAAPMACCRRLCVSRTRMREIVRAGRVWRALSKRPRPPLPPLRQPPSPP